VDYIRVDHRPLPIIEAFSEAALRVWEVTPDFGIHSEAVHRLSGFGAVATYHANGASPEGFDGEWRIVLLLTVDGDRIDRCEVFDESDLDTALARFEELQPRARRLENTASQMAEHFWASFESRDWDATAEIIADDCCTRDRRRVVNADVLRGRAAHVTNMQAVAEAGFDGLASTVLATREHRLALIRIHSSVRGSAPGEVTADMLSVVEIDTDNRLAGAVIFDSDDINAASEELDARYLVGEGAEHAHTWSVIARTYAAFNRHEFPAPTTNSVYIDHRPLVTNDASDLAANIRATWDIMDVSMYIAESVHRLSELGAVVTQTLKGTSKEGLDVEYRMIDIFTVEGDLLSRVEVFDEADLDAALARFDELDRTTPSFGNVATRVWARATEAFNRRDVDSFLALMTANGQFEDRRKGLRAVHEGAARRQAVRAVFEEAPASWRMHAEPIAIRGSRLELTRECYRDTDDADRPIVVNLLHVMRLDDDDLIRDIVSFDPDDLDAAFAELTARWIASGEVAYPEVIEAADRISATINRHDWGAAATHFAGAVYVNHRQLAQTVNGTIADWLSSLQTTASLVPNLWVELAEVLARSAIGIVGRMALKGTSTDGVAVENPFIVLILFHGERVTRLEAFEEDQRDVALARLQEFNRPV
jgi:ketosteroid isomerase-like protein